MTEPIAGRLYVPSHGQRIVMPRQQPDWPLTGQAVDPLNPYHRRMVADGDLVLLPADDAPATKPATGGKK
jgi:hypothetical protein